MRTNIFILKRMALMIMARQLSREALFYQIIHRSALRDIYPRWAQVFDFNYCFAPFDKNIYGSAISLKTAFYFPGFCLIMELKSGLKKKNKILKDIFYENFSSLPTRL